jgi:hypothetical protein
MPVIDAHTHIYPVKIAAKASAGTGNFYDIPMAHDGTAAKLLETGKKAGIDRFVIHSVATSPEQVRSINDFVARAAAEHSEFIGFAAMHQNFADMAGELERVQALGLRGVKMHPDIQRFAVDDREMDRLYGLMEGKLPLLLHAGDNRYGFSNPVRIARVLDRFPGLDIIAAHFGGYTEWDEAERRLAGRRVWVDTSSSLAFIGAERARRLIGLFGEDRVIFGTDYPMWDAEEEMARFNALNLTPEQREKIMYKNICGLLGEDL